MGKYVVQKLFSSDLDFWMGFESERFICGYAVDTDNYLVLEVLCYSLFHMCVFVKERPRVLVYEA